MRSEPSCSSMLNYLQFEIHFLVAVISPVNVYIYISVHNTAM